MDCFQHLPEKSLSVEQETELANRIQKNQQEEDLNELVMNNIKEACIYARKCSKEQIPDGELISLCYTALRRNAKHFKPQFGVRFFAFSKAGVRGELTNYWRSLDTVKGASMHATSDEKEHVEPPEEAVDADFASIFCREDFAIVAEITNRKCTKQEKMILDLTYQKHMNFQEIGALLGVSRSAIQAAHARSIRKIRNELSRQKKLRD